VQPQPESDGSSILLKALFYLVSVLALGSIAYAGWVVIGTWGRVGV